MPVPELPERFSALDAVFLNFEHREMPLHIGGVCIFDGVIPFDRFVATIESKLDLIPRYRQKVMRPLLNVGLPTWQYDPDFDIKRHIFRMELDPPRTEEQLRLLTGRLFTPLMDQSKPLWEIYLVELEGGRSAIICKVHHCIVDGVAGIGLLNLILDLSPKLHRIPRKKPFRPPEPPDWLTLFVDGLADTAQQMPDRILAVREGIRSYGSLLLHDGIAAVGMERVLDHIPELLSPVEHLPFNRPCSGERRVYWTEFSFPEAHAIHEALPCTINDVVLTVVAGAVAKYVRLHGETTKNRFFRPLIPVNVRPPENTVGAFGNLISLLPITLPLGIRDPLERARHISELTQAMKGARMAELVRLGIGSLGVLPPPIQALLAGNLRWLNTPIPLFHMVCTNVPGPQVPLYTCGQRMIKCYPHVPTGMDVGISVAIESYDGKLYFALTTDALAAPDGDRMIGFLEESFSELRKAAGVPALRTKARRKPAPKTRKPKSALSRAAAAGSNGSPAPPAPEPVVAVQQEAPPEQLPVS